MPMLLNTLKKKVSLNFSADDSIAKKFKDNILSQGGTEDPMVLYKRFRGQEPQPEALLKRAGLIKNN